jgi:sulfite exporter TauE/SafE
MRPNLTVIPLQIILRSSQKACACILPSLEITAKISTYWGLVPCGLCYTYPCQIQMDYSKLMIS